MRKISVGFFFFLLWTAQSVASGATLTANPNFLSFNAPPGVIRTQNFTLTLSGAASANFSISSNKPWLSASPSSGSVTSGGRTITVTANGVGRGSFNDTEGRLTISCTGAVTCPQIFVEVEAFFNGVDITISPESVNWTVPSGGQMTETVGITTAPSNATIAVTSDAAWLTTVLANANAKSFTFTAKSAGLSPGNYTGHVNVNCSLNGSPCRNPDVTVSLTVQAANISVSPSSLTFDYEIGTANPSPQGFSIGGTAGVAYTVSDNASWLSVSPNGTTPGNATATVNPGNMAAGSYDGVITVTAPTASNSPRTIAVRLNITQKATLSARPNLITVTYTAGAPLPQPLDLNIEATAAVNFTLAEDAPWLTLSTLGGTTPTRTSVTVNPSGLAKGTYQTAINIASPNATNSPLSIPVILTVSAAGLTAPRTLSLPHAPAGSSFATTIILVNPDTTQDADYSLVFLDPNGIPQVLPLAEGTPAGKIGPGKSAVIRTASLGQDRFGWAELTAPPHVGGSIIYGLTDAAGRIQEGTTNLLSPEAKRFFVPLDDTAQAATSMAIVNAGNATAEIPVTFRYDDGTTENRSLLPPLGSRNYAANTIQQLFKIPAGKRGVAEFNSPQNLQIVAFRFNATLAFTAFNRVAAAAPSPTSVKRTIAHAPTGGGVTTTMVLVNPDTTQAANYALSFVDPTGAPQNLPLESGALTGVIPAGRSVTIKTADAPGATRFGWAELTTQSHVGGSVIYGLRDALGRIQEGTGDLSATASLRFFLPFDDTNQAITSMALVNSANAAANITVVFRFDDGTVETKPKVLPARNYIANTVQALFGQTAGKRGVAEFISDQPLNAIAFRFNATSAYTAFGTVQPQ